jgi:murein DD-endopeptidase MepM/ murein hydrolase activator NlpD
MAPTRISEPTPTAGASASPTQAYFLYAFPLQPADACDYAPGVAAHGYPAIDIFAPHGTDFVAVTSGVVDFVSPEDLWDPAIDDPATRGGLAVAMVGDDGVRYYGSHLSEVAPGIVPGARVERGQLLGTVGSTGNAQGKDSHLHFGISHPTYPEDWHTRRGEVDPFPYLEAWKIGVDIMPRLP